MLQYTSTAARHPESPPRKQKQNKNKQYQKVRKPREALPPPMLSLVSAQMDTDNASKKPESKRAYPPNAARDTSQRKQIEHKA